MMSDQCSTLLNDDSSRRFLAYSAGFVSLVTFSCYVEEWIFKVLPGFKFPWMVAFVELLLFSVWAGAQQRWEHGNWAVTLRRRAPLRMYAGFSICLALSQSLGKVTLLYMNYATSTIVKSGKLVPTLMLSVVWLRKPVSLVEWVAAGLMVASSALMALGEHLSDINFQPMGLVVAFFQLLAASLQGNVQERVLKDYDATISEAMFFGNSFGAALVLGAMVANGEAPLAVAYFLEMPFALLLLVVRSVTFLLGAIALNVLTKEYGTGAATAVGTARKSMTVLFSFALFPKPYHVNYALGFAAFLAADATYLHVASQRAARRAKHRRPSSPDDLGAAGPGIGRPSEQPGAAELRSLCSAGGGDPEAESEA